jgi:FMN phosphatase YigB (HAD superfamily)
VFAALGMTIERGEDHWALWDHLGVERPVGVWERFDYDRVDLYPDAVACLERLRDEDLLVGLAGNQSRTMEAWARATLPADVVTSSDGVGARKPDPAFFERLVELARMTASDVAYVGDRVDNDVLPALAVGLVAVHCRRGPWGRLRPTPAGAIAIDSLAELPGALASVA